MNEFDPKTQSKGIQPASLVTESDKSFNAVITRRTDLTRDAAIFHVAPTGWKLPEFTPGQFATLGLPKGESVSTPNPTSTSSLEPFPHDGDSHSHSSGLIRRAYSIASPPSNDKYLEFYIIHVEGGQFTTRLWNLLAGNRLWLDTHFRGHFTLEHVEPSSDLLLVATGTGIAPYMSMLREYRTRHRWRRAAVIHGVRFEADLAYRAELEQLADDDDAFAYVPTVTREPVNSKWAGRRGRIQSLFDDPAEAERLTGISLDPTRVNVMLCGNPAMILDVQSLLESRGFKAHSHDEPGNIHFERYW